MRRRRSAVFAVAALLAALAGRPLRAEDGLLDPTFSSDGLLLLGWSAGTVPGKAFAIASAPDGSLLVGGDVEVAVANPDLGFVRLTADGSVDPSWGALGRRTVPIDAEPGGDDSVRALTLLPDGSAIAAGFTLFYFPNAQFPTYRPALVRLDPDGDLDPNFGVGGVAVVDLPWPTDDFDFQKPVLQPDGKAVYAGYCYDCPLAGDGHSTLLLRVGTDGLPDPTFSGDGWIRESSGVLGAFNVDKVALDALGRIVLYGSTSDPNTVGLLRLTPAGAIDTTFGGGDGLATFNRPVGTSNPYGLSIDAASGAIYVSNYSASGTNQGFSLLRRFAADGTQDQTFGGDGEVELIYQEGILIEDLLVQSDGKIVAGGYRLDQQTNDRAWILFRLFPNGAPDNSFDSNGLRLVDFGQPSGPGENLYKLHLAGGRLLAVGSIDVGGTERYGMSRLTSDLIVRDGFESSTTAVWAGN